MQSWIMMALGAYRFALSTAAYQEFERMTEYTWPIHPRAGKPPLIQFTGGGNDQIILQGTILPEFQGGTRQIDLMRLEAGLGIPLLLVSGYGNYYGMFAIAMIQERQREFWPDGTPPAARVHRYPDSVCRGQFESPWNKHKLFSKRASRCSNQRIPQPSPRHCHRRNCGRMKLYHLRFQNPVNEGKGN